MSYILDALRKSETERRQGKIPDLGQQVQLIHQPRKKRISPVVWIAVALVINALVLAVVFWPITPVSQPDRPVTSGSPSSVPRTETISEDAASASGVPAHRETRQDNQADSVPANQIPESGRVSAAIPEPVIETPVSERPTIIVPSPPVAREQQPLPDTQPPGRVPHLVELPLSFQKSIPDLMFNSHIYGSEPSARRVMINNNYLRRGDTFSGIKVEDITEDGVVLSKHGQRFRVGIVRDWVSPR